MKDAVTREQYFMERATGMTFRRTVGALVWPCGEKPGCVIALGETRSRQNILGMRRHDLHKLEEYQHISPAELVERLALMTSAWMIRSWATPLCDQRAYLIEDMNDALRKERRHIIRYGDPLGWHGKGEGQLPFYHAFIQRRTLEEKTLYLGADSLCADEVGKMAFGDAKKSLLEYPSAAALCFAVAEVDMDPKKDWGEGRLDDELFGPADDLGGY